MINTVVLVGRLTKDPELKYTQGGIAVTRFTLAVNRPFSNQQGQREADFVNCVTWRKQAENTANYLRKGSLAGIEGRIQTSNFEGKDGNRVYMTEVVADSVQFLEPRSATSGERSESNSGGAQQRAQQPMQQSNQHTNQQPSQQPSQQQSSQQPSQQNYTRMNDDPFSTGGGPIEVSDDDLPF